MREMTLEEIAACCPKGRVVWLDAFDVGSCCQKDNLEDVSGFDGSDGSWVLTFVRAPEEFTKGMGFIPLRCRTCGRYWFRVACRNKARRGKDVPGGFRVFGQGCLGDGNGFEDAKEGIWTVKQAD